MTSLMLYVPSFCVSTLQSTQFMSIPFRGPKMMSNKLEQMCPPVIQQEIGKVARGSREAVSEKSLTNYLCVG